MLSACRCGRTRVCCPPVIAQSYPTRPCASSWGPVPTCSRALVGQKLTESWGQQVVVDQRPGAGGSSPPTRWRNRPPDGYTLLLTTGAYTVNAALYPKLPYSLERDLAPVASARVDFVSRDREPFSPREIDEGARAARALETGPAQLRALRSRHDRAPRLRDAENERRASTSCRCSYKGTGPGRHRRDRGPVAIHVRGHAGRAAARAGGQAPRRRGHRGEARSGPSGRAHDYRSGFRRRGLHHLERGARACRHPALDRRQAQRRLQSRAEALDIQEKMAGLGLDPAPGTTEPSARSSRKTSRGGRR